MPTVVAGRPASVPPEVDAMITGVFRRNQRALQTCYERSLRARPDLGGRWKIGLDLATSGAPAAVRARPVDQPDAPMQACIEQEVGTWRFSPIKSQVTWSDTFTFQKQ